MEERKMTNFQVYKKTLSFSLVAFLFDLIGLALFAGGAAVGFLVMKDKDAAFAILGLVVGAFVGGILAYLISLFITNRFKCAQIAMMTKGVTENQLPEHTYRAGLDEMKGKFGKITLFFVITNAIKGVFREIGRGMTKVGQAVGGDVGGGIASAIDSGVQTVIAYLCDCCLGWIFYRKDINAFKAGCEGAVIFFKHGKTLVRNVGRIFGMGFLSLLLIGGAATGLLYLIFRALPNLFISLADTIKGMGDMPEFLTRPETLMIAAAVVIAIIFWAMVHSVLIRPFILTGVLRNFMAAGIKDMPSEADIQALEKKSPKLAKLAAKAK
jgi:hypothetical protein